MSNKHGKLIPVCVYCDSTDLYSEDEIAVENLTDLLFPERIVRAWYEAHKSEFDDETSYELDIPEPECDFQKWYEEVYTAIDTDGLYDFAIQMGFTPTRETQGL